MGQMHELEFTNLVTPTQEDFEHNLWRPSGFQYEPLTCESHLSEFLYSIVKSCEAISNSPDIFTLSDVLGHKMLMFVEDVEKTF